MTIKDIAKLCGVSTTTVSRVLNDHPDVSEENRQKVLATIRAHHYIPNNNARTLVKTTSKSIGLVVRGISNPFYTTIIQSIEAEITARGYSMVMQQISSADDEIRVGAMMERDQRLQGILFLGGRFDYTQQEVATLNVPFVCCSYSNHYGTLPADTYSSVSIDDEQEAYQAVLKLIQAGHRKIAALICTPDDKSISQLRYQGYLRALKDNGIEVDKKRVICAEDFHIHNAYHATCQALQEAGDFTALFSISDNMAIGAMRALRESGRRIPEDCSVIAIDGLEVSDYIKPRLTTLCQPMARIGQRSVDILLARIQGAGENHHEILPTEFRQGETLGKI